MSGFLALLEMTSGKITIMKTIIKLQNIKKSISGTEILHGISFEVKKGEVFGFIGPNGAGKTTTLKTILGIIEATDGEIKIFGKSPREREVQRKIGFMPENTYLYKYLTGDEFLDFSAGFYNLEKDFLEKRKNWILEKVGLSHARDRRLSTYSKGMLQRIGIAQAILHDPELIFLDEPMSGLDPIGRKMIKDLLLELKNAGKTIFLNSHILSDVEVICDRFAIIFGGNIIATDRIKNLKEPLEDFFMKKISGASGGEKVEVE